MSSMFHFPFRAFACGFNQRRVIHSNVLPDAVKPEVEFLVFRQRALFISGCTGFLRQFIYL